MNFDELYFPLCCIAPIIIIPLFHIELWTEQDYPRFSNVISYISTIIIIVTFPVSPFIVLPYMRWVLKRREIKRNQSNPSAKRSIDWSFLSSPRMIALGSMIILGLLMFVSFGLPYLLSYIVSPFIQVSPALSGIIFIFFIGIILFIRICIKFHHSDNEIRNIDVRQSSVRRSSDCVSNDTSDSATDPPPPPISRPQKTCHLIWLSAYHISRHAGVTQHASLTGQLWATMFYIFAKYVRKQTIVDEIYSHFEASASSIDNGKAYPNSILYLIKHAYVDYGKMLNRLNIDPRSPEGLNTLWDLFEKRLAKYRTPHPDARKAFMEYSAILISDASQYSSMDESQK